MFAPAAVPSSARSPAPATEVVQPVAVRSARVLSLLLILEALRDAPATKETTRN